MNLGYLLILPVIFPMAAGILSFFIRKFLPLRKNYLIYVFASLVIEFGLLLAAVWEERSLVLWQLADHLQIAFHVDTISGIFAILVGFVWMCAGLYSFEYMKHEENEGRFFGFYLIVEGTLAALCLSDNLVCFYIFFELMTFTSLPLVLHELHEKAIMAGLKYLFYSMAGAFLALFGIFFLSRLGALGSFAPGGILDDAAVAEHGTMLLAMAMCMIVGFGTKAGMFPMHGWLPTAHPEAPAPASAVLSGVITKMGVLALIRVVYYVIGPKNLKGTWVQTVWLALALITVFMGSMMAYRESVTKKRLAYSTVSQVSYVLFGLACMQPVAFVGAVLHVVFHSMVKNTLFFAAGAFIYKTGKTRVEELLAIGKEMPVVMWCYTLVSITLVGIPPTSGFVSKWYLATGSLAGSIPVFSWLGPVILLISALLTAAYLLPITIHGFFPGADFDYASLEKKEPSWLMTLPMIAMTAAAVLFGMFPGVLTSLLTAVSATVF